MSAQGFLFGFPFRMTEAKVRARPSWQPLIVGCGGGQNTGGVLAEMKARGIRPDAVVMADTAATDPERRGELPDTYEWLERHLQPWLKRADFPPLTIIYNKSPKSGHRSLYEECITNGVLPGKAYGYGGCTTKWKVQPLMDWVRNWGGADACYAATSKPIKIVGYDASDKDVDRAERMGDEDRLHAFWFPLVEWQMDRRACVEAVKRAGLPVPVSSMCFFCPSRRPLGILDMRAKHPRLFDAAVSMEDNARARGGIGNGIKGLGRDWSWKQLAEMHDDDLRRIIYAETREDMGCMTCAVDAPREVLNDA